MGYDDVAYWGFFYLYPKEPRWYILPIKPGIIFGVASKLFCSLPNLSYGFEKSYDSYNFHNKLNPYII